MEKVLRYILFFSLFLAANINLKAQADGLMFGMTYGGGNISAPYGVINQFDPLTYNDTTYVDFTGLNGAHPYGNFIQLNNGLLYGVTAYNCTSPNTNPENGTILQYNIQTRKDSILYILPYNGGNYDSGAFLFGSLCHATNDLLYGFAYYGGEYSGVLFSFNYHTGEYRVLVELRGRTIGYNATGSLIQSTNGLLYGMTTVDNYGYGSIFSYNTITDTAILLYSFAGAPTDGNYPRGNLLQVNDTMLYGLTIYGGISDSGTLFSFNTNTNVEKSLVNFNKASGAYPQESLMIANDGNLYGTTLYGGVHDSGTLFKYNIATNTESILYSFNGSDTDGYFPSGDLIQATDGKLYGNTLGNTSVSGLNNWGTIFSYDLTSHKKKTLYYYNYTNGAYPYGDLLEAMSANITAVNNICPNDSSGSLTINVRGDKPPLTYSWSTGATTSSITNLKSGIYYDTVWDSRGIHFSFIDTLKPLPMIPVFNVSNSCSDTNNGSVSVAVSGGSTPYTYLWSNSKTTDTISGLSSGSYACTITDAGGCSINKTIVLTQASPIVIDSIVAVEQTYPGNNGKVTVYVKGGVPPGDTTCYFYLWSNGGADSSTITGLDSGSYSVCVTSCYGCGSTCSGSAKVLTGTKNFNNQNDLIAIYPIPSTGLITLSIAGNNFENLEVTDALGRPVYKEFLTPEQKDRILHIDLSTQPNGVYILYITSQQGLLTRKIIIQK